MKIRLVALGSTLVVIQLGIALPAPPPPSLQITMLPGVPISTDEPGADHVESWLAVNPRDSRNLIAASMVLGGPSVVAVYSSRDGGKTWARATHGSKKNPVFDGLDPAATFDSDGTAYFLSAGDSLSVWKSSDGGRTWGEGVIVPGRAWDRPFLAVAPSGPERSARFHVAGKLPIKVFGHVAEDVIGVSTSEDGGASFRFPRLILPAPEKELLNVVGDLAIASDGALVLALQLFPPQDLRAPLLGGWYSTIRSTDGGRTFSEPRRAAGLRVYGHGWEGKSLLGLGGGRLAADTSRSPTRGRLYLAWLDVVDGFFQVMAAASADGGITWSAPVRVNDNRSPSDASNPAIAVNDEGVVGITWNDRRADESGRCFQVSFAASADGAASFSANQRVSEDRTCPIGKDAGDPVESEFRFKNGGDTQGLVGLPGGGFHIAWINGASGKMQLWSTAVSVEMAGPGSRRVTSRR